jgi:antirestriction protein ArdC
LITGNAYRGVNVWLLNALNFERNLFLTFNQVNDLGALVRRGEKAQLVVFWRWKQQDSATPIITGTARKKVPVLCYYHVFNIAQCQNLPEDCLLFDEPLKKNDPIKICEEIIELMPHAPEIRHRGDEAYYHPFFDLVNMPGIDRFIDSETYYATLFDELIHSTGHQSRLNRKELQTPKPKDFDEYSLEKLTGEIGACYLNSYAGIDGWDLTNHIAYIDNWIKRLQSDNKCIVYASAQAQRAADYILNMNQSSGEVGMIEQEFLKLEVV